MNEKFSYLLGASLALTACQQSAVPQEADVGSLQDAMASVSDAATAENDAGHFFDAGIDPIPPSEKKRNLSAEICADLDSAGVPFHLNGSINRTISSVGPGKEEKILVMSHDIHLQVVGKDILVSCSYQSKVPPESSIFRERTNKIGNRFLQYTSNSKFVGLQICTITDKVKGAIWCLLDENPMNYRSPPDGIVDLEKNSASWADQGKHIAGITPLGSPEEIRSAFRTGETRRQGIQADIFEPLSLKVKAATGTKTFKILPNIGLADYVKSFIGRKYIL